jgi:hypothetical protein
MDLRGRKPPNHEKTAKTSPKEAMTVGSDDAEFTPR